MKISYINFSEEYNVVTYDYFWISLKCYIEDNYRGETKHEWATPHKSSYAKDLDELVDRILLEVPDILLVSLYVWNHGLSTAVAERVKQELPECIVIFGGPHLLYKSEPDYFQKHDYIDFLCASDAYGEVFMNEFLYQLETSKSWLEVPFLIMPNEDRSSYVASKKFFNKRQFQWPKRIFERNESYLLDVKRQSRSDLPMYMIYESSRGCPFGCTYCEWGGGINAKTNFKPDEYVYEDLEFIFEIIRPEFFSFTDANFGIVPRDIDISKRLCDYKKEVNSPLKVYLYGPTKVRKENLYQIESMFAENDMLGNIKIPVQDLNSVVHENIKRTDDHWESQMAEYQEIRKRTNITIGLEMILGLPGADINSYYESINAAKKYDVGMIRYEWYLLPTAPAAEPEYVKKYQIESIRVNAVTNTGNSMIRRNIKRKGEDVIGKNESINLVNSPDFVEPIDIVVSTYSYTKEDWAQMWFMDKLVYVGEMLEYFRRITDYLEYTKGITPGEFYSRMWKNFIDSDRYLIGKQLDMMQSLLAQIRSRVHNESKGDSFFYFEIPHCFVPDAVFKLVSAIKYAINVNRYQFYRSLNDWAQIEFKKDDALADLIEWNSNMIKWIDYAPGKTMFDSRYDWNEWFKTKNLVKKNTRYEPCDITYGEDRIVDWHYKEMKERVLQNFLPMCSDDSTNSWLFQNVKVT